MNAHWQRVNELFNAALTRPAADRARFVADRAREDVLLRDEVLSLIDAHEQAGSFLEKPAGLTGGADHDDVPPILKPGDTIGAYHIEAELGRGGMGMVYLAEDLKLGRKVALKALPPHFIADTHRRERLRKEARAAARLSHPGIATVFALEELDDHLFIVGEYVPGRTLRAELDAGLVSVDRVIDVAAQLAAALGAAHAAGVIHRDLKPENVMCSDAGLVKILDFGVARSLGETGRTTQRLTDAGMLVGTPAYMSPEQLEGSDVDARSDMFAFGVLIYELATGVHPFDGASPASIIARILGAEPKPARDVRRQLPPELERVIGRCLQKRPEDRYQSTADLAVDLAQLRTAGRTPPPSVPTPARKTAGPTAPPAVRWWRVHQVAIAGVYAAMTLAAWLASHGIKADWIPPAILIAVLSAALNGTLRVHMLFTERHNPQAFRSELRRSSPWLRVSDVVFGLVLLVIAGLLAKPLGPWSVFLGAVGAGIITVSIAVEPATIHAAFPKRPTGVRRGTPPKPAPPP
jgi:serine/threonine protein kinase